MSNDHAPAQDAQMAREDPLSEKTGLRRERPCYFCQFYAPLQLT